MNPELMFTSLVVDRLGLSGTPAGFRPKHLRILQVVIQAITNDAIVWVSGSTFTKNGRIQDLHASEGRDELLASLKQGGCRKFMNQFLIQVDVHPKQVLRALQAREKNAAKLRKTQQSIKWLASPQTRAFVASVFRLKHDEELQSVLDRWPGGTGDVCDKLLTAAAMHGKMPDRHDFSLEVADQDPLDKFKIFGVVFLVGVLLIVGVLFLWQNLQAAKSPFPI